MDDNYLMDDITCMYMHVNKYIYIHIYVMFVAEKVIEKLKTLAVKRFWIHSSGLSNPFLVMFKGNHSWQTRKSWDLAERLVKLELEIIEERVCHIELKIWGPPPKRQPWKTWTMFLGVVGKLSYPKRPTCGPPTARWCPGHCKSIAWSTELEKVHSQRKLGMKLSKAKVVWQWDKVFFFFFVFFVFLVWSSYCW